MVDLPTIANGVPSVHAPQSRVSAGQISSPYLELATELDRASQETSEYAKREAHKAGLKAVTRDADGNVQVEKAPIIGPAALEYQHAVQVAAVADGENVIKDDMLKMRHEFKDDPEGFRKAAAAYTPTKVAQYEKAAGPDVGLALGKVANSTARETHEGLLNHKEALDLQRSTTAIQSQIELTKNELFAIAAGGDTTSPAYVQRLQKMGALYGQLVNNPRIAYPREKADFEISHVNSELALANLGFRVAKIQNEQGTEAALAEADKVRTDAGLNLRPTERFNTYARLVQGIELRSRNDERADRRIVADIDRHAENAANGIPPTAGEIGVLRQVVAQRKSPELTARLNELETIAPIISDLRKASPAQLESILAEQEKVMAESGASPAAIKLHAATSKLLKNAREGIKTDPLGWGTKTGGAPVSPIDWGNADTLDAQLRNRVVEAESNAQKYSITPSYLRPDERAMLKAATAKGGDAMTGVAAALVSGFGEKAPLVLREISKDSPVLAHIGGLMSSNGSPSVISDAAEAVRLRQDPEAAKTLPNYLTKEPAKMQAAQHSRAADVYGGAFSMVPDTRRAAEATAQSAFFTRAYNNNYDPMFIERDAAGAKTAYDRTLQEAAGATFSPSGVQYGGVTSYRPGTFQFFGGSKVLIPGNIRTDRFTDVIGALKDEDIRFPAMAPPTAPDGRPYSAKDLKNATPVAVQGGYRFAAGDPMSDNPKWIRGADGKPFVLDLERLEPTLRKRVPEAYSP